MNRIHYRRLRKYKYQLTRDYSMATAILPDTSIETPYISLGVDGALLIRKGYAWDGPSGPSIDTQTFMRGALVHDALYQLMRSSELSMIWRDDADLLLKQICREDGMNRMRAWWVYRSVRAFGKGSASPQPRDGVNIA